MAAKEEALRAGLGAFLTEQWRDEARVEAISRIPGGASRETWRCRVATAGATRGLIVRVDPETSLIDTKQILDIPLNGRDFTQLLKFNPGANANACQSARRSEPSQ